MPSRELWWILSWTQEHRPLRFDWVKDKHFHDLPSSLGSLVWAIQHLTDPNSSPTNHDDSE